MVSFRGPLYGSWFGIHDKVLRISMTELFVIMNSLTITEKNKNQWIYRWICDIQMIWKLSDVNLLSIIVFELLKRWIMFIVSLFLVLIFSIWLTIKLNNSIKFCSQISEKIWSNLYLCGRGPIKSVLFVCPSVCLSVRRDAFFSGFTLRIFLIFCMRVFCLIY